MTPMVRVIKHVDEKGDTHLQLEINLTEWWHWVVLAGIIGLLIWIF